MNALEVDVAFKGVKDRAYMWSSKTRAPAPWPELTDDAVNVRSIELACRPKEFSIEFDESRNEIRIEWKTQESCYEHSLFDAELHRCFYDVLRFDGAIAVHLYDRDGYDDFIYTLRN